MIDFEILLEGKKRYISWDKLCGFMGVKPYYPNTPELVSVKEQLADRMVIPLDDVVVRLNRQPIL
jgi:hypothetical protein